MVFATLIIRTYYFFSIRFLDKIPQFFFLILKIANFMTFLMKNVIFASVFFDILKLKNNYDTYETLF